VTSNSAILLQSTLHSIRVSSAEEEVVVVVAEEESHQKEVPVVAVEEAVAVAL